MPNVLEGKQIFARIRLDTKGRYYPCRVLRVMYSDKVSAATKCKPETRQRYIFVDIELTGELLPPKAKGHRHLSHLPMERIHHSMYGRLVHYAFEQEALDLKEQKVGQHCEQQTP